MGTNFGTGGTLRWMAPELFGESPQISFTADIYAFACICIEVHPASILFGLLGTHIVIRYLAPYEETPIPKYRERLQGYVRNLTWISSNKTGGAHKLT